jgi:hypothetical protein
MAQVAVQVAAEVAGKLGDAYTKQPIWTRAGIAAATVPTVGTFYLGLVFFFVVAIITIQFKGVQPCWLRNKPDGSDNQNLPCDKKYVGAWRKVWVSALIALFISFLANFALNMAGLELAGRAGKVVGKVFGFLKK